MAPDELERRCRDLGRAVAHEVLNLLWSRDGTGDQGPAGQCPCGGTRRRRGLRPRPLRDLMNWSLTVERAYYFCAACGQGWLPLDEALGLPRAAATPVLFAVAVTCGRVAPPEEAAELLAASAGITLSPKSLERYTKAAGHATDRTVEQRAPRRGLQAQRTLRGLLGAAVNGAGRERPVSSSHESDERPRVDDRPDPSGR